MNSLRLTFRMLLVTAAVSLSSGCYSIWDQFDGGCMSVRNYAGSQLAWWQCRGSFCDCDCPHDFGRGFRQGYRDICDGKSGCTPVVAPRSYWGVFDQTAAGHNRIGAWQEGYANGVIAAQQEGAGQWSQMPIYRPEGYVPPYARQEIYDSGTLPEPTPIPAEPTPIPAEQSPLPYDPTGSDRPGGTGDRPMGAFLPSARPVYTEPVPAPSFNGIIRPRQGDNPFRPAAPPEVNPFLPEAQPADEESSGAAKPGLPRIVPSAYEPGAYASDVVGPSGYSPEPYTPEVMGPSGFRP